MTADSHFAWIKKRGAAHGGDRLAASDERGGGCARGRLAARGVVRLPDGGGGLPQGHEDGGEHRGTAADDARAAGGGDSGAERGGGGAAGGARRRRAPRRSGYRLCGWRCCPCGGTSRRGRAGAWGSS